jgi:ubiquitin carboxyl-terminal hydrolase 10
MQDGASGSSDSDANQQMLIEALPPVLVLHLKRFRYDAAAGGIIKISKHVQFSPELDIPSGAPFSFKPLRQLRLRTSRDLVVSDVMVPTVRQSAKPAHYTLCGVLYHHGESASGGHYTVDVLHPNGDGDTGRIWLHINDEAVTPVRHEDVFGEHGTDRAADGRCAYLLFYCRTPKDTS